MAEVHDAKQLAARLEVVARSPAVNSRSADVHGFSFR